MTDRSDVPTPDTARHDAALDETLAEAVDALPRSIAPDRDLWPAIAARLEPRAARGAEPRSTRRPLRVAAAVAWMALGALTALGIDRALDARSVETQAPKMASEAASEPAAVPVSGAGPVDGAASFAVAEAELLRVKDRLWLTVVERRDRLSPATFEIVERNLEIIDLAVRDLQRALVADPANPRLERALLDSHRRGIDLLRLVAQEA